MTDGRWVSYDRWDEAHRATLMRLMNVENDLHGLRGAEQEHRALEDRIAAVEDEMAEREKGEHTRRDRAWALVLIVISGVVLPVLVTAVIGFLHLRSYK